MAEIILNTNRVQNSQDNNLKTFPEWTLQDLVDFATQIYNKELDTQQIMDRLEGLYVSTYLPIMEKYKLISLILFDYSMVDVQDVQGQTLHLELEKFWTILMAYLHIKTTGYEHLKTIENYDLLIHTVSIMVLPLCQIDYERTCKMLDSAINLYNVSHFVNGLQEIDTDNILKNTKKIKETFDYLNQHKETISNLMDIIKLNNGI